MVRTDMALKIGGLVLLAFVTLALLSALVSFTIWVVETLVTIAVLVGLAYLAYLAYGYLTDGGGKSGGSRSRSREKDRIFER